MEEDIQNYMSSKKNKIVEKRLEKAVKAAERAVDYESAHNQELLKALSIVEDFIKRKKRVCYGGTAMNEILPSQKRFYNPEVDLPDYDFYTPEIQEDVEELVKDLQEAGFKDVYNKVGMHEGTKKILVNFIPVADVSHIDPELFAVIYRRSIVKGGIHYTDPDMLRMMMYLELSRPRGEVSRWEKVFDRLKLINSEFPVRAACHSARQRYDDPIDVETRKKILDYAIKHKRILCNGPLAHIYAQGIRHGNAKYEIRGGGPFLLTSADPKADATALKEMLPEGLEMYLHKERGEIVPLRIELRRGDTPVCMFIKETGCHSYTLIPLPDKRSIRIASLEFLITLYLSIDIFTSTAQDYIGERVLCQVKRLIELSQKNYRAKKSQFPPFSLKCEGHQSGFASLLRAKVARAKKEHEEEKRRTRKEKRKERARAKSQKRNTR